MALARDCSSGYFFWLNNLLAFALLASALNIANALGLTAILFLLCSILFIWFLKPAKLDNGERVWILSLGLFFLIALVNIVFFSESSFQLRALDIPLRFLLVIPVYLYWKRSGFGPAVFWNGALFGALGAGGWAIYQHFVLDWPHAKGMTGHHIVFGDVALCLALVCFIAAVTQYSSSNRIHSALFSLASLSGLVASLFSGARGGWLALPVLFVFFLWFFRDRISPRTWVLVLVLPMLAVVLVVFGGENFVKNRFKQAVNDVMAYYVHDRHTTSVGYRLEMFKSAWIIFTEKPLTGSGVDTFIQKSNSLAAQGKVRDIPDILAHPHNEFLNGLYSRGLPGLLVVIAVFAAPMVFFARRLRQRYSPFAIVGFVVPLAFVVFAMSEAILDRALSVTFYVFFMSMVYLLYHQETENEQQQIGAG